MINSLDHSPGQCPREYSPYRFYRLSRFKMWQPESPRNRKSTRLQSTKVKLSFLAWHSSPTLSQFVPYKYGVPFHGFMKWRLQHKKQVLFYRAQQYRNSLEQQIRYCWISALSLLVFRVLTDDHDVPFSLNDFAFFANRFNWWTYFHYNYLLI